MLLKPYINLKSHSFLLVNQTCLCMFIPPTMTYSLPRIVFKTEIPAQPYTPPKHTHWYVPRPSPPPIFSKTENGERECMVLPTVSVLLKQKVPVGCRVKAGTDLFQKQCKQAVYLVAGMMLRSYPFRPTSCLKGITTLGVSCRSAK